MNGVTILGLTTLSLVSTLLCGSEMSLNGYSKAYAYLDYHSGEYSRLGNRFQTRFTGDQGSHLSWVAALNYDYDTAADPSPGLEIRPVESYVNLAWQRVDLTLGRQFVFWGKTSWINPSDVINPWDYAHISSEIEDYRIPVWAVNTQVYWPQFTFQAVVIPRFTPDVIPYPPLPLTLPVTDMNNTQLALRFLSWIGQTDWSLGYYQGFNSTPEIRFRGMNMDLVPPVPNLELCYRPIHMLSADFARSLSSFTIKGEAACFLTDDKDGRDPLIGNDRIEAVLGLDWALSDKLSLTAQASGTSLLNYDRELERKRIEEMHAGDYLTASPRRTSSLSAMVTAEALPYTTLQLIHVFHRDQGDNFSLAFLSWDMMDGVSLTGGLLFFNGPASSPFGMSRNADTCFLEMKVSF